MKDLKDLVRPNVWNMKPYSSARDEFQGNASVFLDANENPFNRPYNRYPDPLQWELKKKIAEIKGVKRESIFLGNGSDEPIDLIIRAFCEPSIDSIVSIAPSYGMYEVAANVNNVEFRKIKLDEKFDLDTDSLLEAANDWVKVIFLCSPNNPTGNNLSRDRLYKVLNTFQGIVVIDEAYVDFGGVSSIELTKKYENLLVTGTFSKSRSLAGMRIGFAIGSKTLISVLEAVKNSYNSYTVDALSIAMGIASVEDDTYFKSTVAKIIATRTRVTQELRALGFEVIDSQTNFIMATHPDLCIRDLFEYLKSKKVFIRYFNLPRIDNYTRITIGTDDEMDIFLNEVKNYLGDKK